MTFAVNQNDTFNICAWGNAKFSCTWSRPYKEALLSNIEVNVSAALVGDETSKVSPGYTMPNTLISFFESALHVRGE